MDKASKFIYFRKKKNKFSQHFQMLSHFLLVCLVFNEKSLKNLIFVPLYVTSFVSLAAFNMFSLSLVFSNLIVMCLGIVFSVYPAYSLLNFFYLWAYGFRQICKNLFENINFLIKKKNIFSPSLLD